MLNLDLDKITEQIEEVLDAYDIPYDHDVVRSGIVHTWYERKKPLLELFSKHPNWDNACCAAVFESDFQREADCCAAREALHCIYDLAITTPGHKESAYRIGSYLSWDVCCGTPTVTERSKAEFSHIAEVRVGMRTSRAFARVFDVLGINQIDTLDTSKDKPVRLYERYFAELADAVSPVNIKRHTVLSFHPCDYLLMSKGTGWKSCHRIDGGEWQGGTWSYMLDNVSAILYTVDKGYDNADKRIWNERKIHRMVCCFQGQEILFSRLYPDYGDIATRKKFRSTVQGIYTACLDLPNLWQKPLPCPNEFVYSGEGHMNYADYAYGCYNAELSVLSGQEPERIEIGTYGICPVCSALYDDCEHMACCNGNFAYCEDCGERINLDDDEDYYTTHDGRYICTSCFGSGYFACDDCNRVFPNDDGYTTAENHMFCSRCVGGNATECSCCGSLFLDWNTIYDEETDQDFCRECYQSLLETREEERVGA